MKKINNNVYYLKNETKTINTIKKTIILEKKSKYDSLDFSILLDTLTNRIENYNKLEFKKIKALNYNLNFKASFKEISNNILITLKVEFINLNFVNNPVNILNLIEEIFNGIFITEEDLILTIKDYNKLYKQIKDMNDQYIKYILKDQIYKDEPTISTYEENINYLKNLKPQALEQKKNLLKSKNFYYILEGPENKAKDTIQHFEQTNKELKVYTKSDIEISQNYKKIELLKNKEQVSIAMSYQGKINKVEDEYTLKLLNSILGRSAFSLLFKNVREKESLCYSIYSQEDLNYGINIFTGVEFNNVNKAEQKIEEQFKNIIEGNFQEEYIKAKEKYIADLKQDSKKLITQEILLQKNIIYGTKNYEIDKIISKIENITKEDIQKMCKRLKLTKIVLKN